MSESLTRPVFFRVGLWHAMVPDSIEDMGYPISCCPKSHGRREYLNRGMTFGLPPKEVTCVECLKSLARHPNEVVTIRPLAAARPPRKVGAPVRAAGRSSGSFGPIRPGTLATERNSRSANQRGEGQGPAPSGEATTGIRDAARTAAFRCDKCSRCGGWLIDGGEFHRCIGPRGGRPA